MDDRGYEHITSRSTTKGGIVSRSANMSAELSAPSPPPPPYSLSDPRSHRLKECFTSLLGKQSQIQTLFDVVAERLQQFGEHHPLVEEWTALRQVCSYTGAGESHRTRADIPNGTSYRCTNRLTRTRRNRRGDVLTSLLVSTARQPSRGTG